MENKYTQQEYIMWKFPPILCFQKWHYQAVILLNLNSTSLFGNSSAEETIKVLIMFHASGFSYVYIFNHNSPSSVCFFLPGFPLWVYPCLLTAHGCAVHQGSESGTKHCDNLTLPVRVNQRRDWSRCEQTVHMISDEGNAKYLKYLHLTCAL